VTNIASELVTRLVDDVMNSGDLDGLGQLFSQEIRMRQLAGDDATLGELGSLG
jgi:hypothetical protein